MQEKKENNRQLLCSKCGSSKIKAWDELTADEKFLVERMPASGETSPGRKERRLFCARCFYEVPGGGGGAAENA